VELRDFLSQRPRTFYITVAYSLVAVICLAERVIPFNLGGFYVIPIALVSWFVGKQAGIWIALISAFTWLLPDYSGDGYTDPLIIRAGNTAIRICFNSAASIIIWRLKQAHEMEKTYARIDGLTGVANRRHFLELIELELKRADRYGHPFTVAFMDLDNFKYINDEFGHLVGDRLLATVGKILVSHIRRTDAAARLGGDEFAVLFPETNSDHARTIASDLGKELGNKMRENQWEVTFSIGVVTFLQSPPSTDDVIARVDQAMYTVKAGTKDAIHYEIYGEQAPAERREIS